MEKAIQYNDIEEGFCEKVQAHLNLHGRIPFRPRRRICFRPDVFGLDRAGSFL